MLSRLDMHAATHQGKVRPRNEDSWWFDPATGLAVVADGMGGHPAGADASALAVRSFVEAFRGNGVPTSSEALGAAMARSVEAAHEGIREAVKTEPGWEGMGTTLTAAAFGGGDALLVAHVGDSRAYRLRGGRLETLTRDHTWVAEAVASGRIAPAAAAAHPLAHVLTQAVGIDMAPHPDVEAHDLRADDVILLCSDGLTGPVDDAHIERILGDALESGQLDEAPRRLVEAALDGGGPDNVTAVVVRVTQAG